MSDLTDLKVNMAEFQKDIKYIKEKLDSHIAREDATIERIENSYNEFLKNAKESFASKTTERIVYSLVGIILIGVIGAWIKIVIPVDTSKSITEVDIQRLIDANNGKIFSNPEVIK